MISLDGTSGLVRAQLRDRAGRPLRVFEGRLVHKEIGTDGRVQLVAEDEELSRLSISIPFDQLEEIPPAEVSVIEIRRRMLEVSEHVATRRPL